MVYSFVHMASGHIRVESTLGAGSVFRLGFPKAPSDALAKGDAPPISAPRSRSHQIILVVEDDDDVRQHSVETLRDLGYRVIEAHDGSAALSLLAKHRGHIALMFCDIGLPNGENGRELAQQARESLPSLRVLYTSGSTDGPDANEAAAVADVIPKPFTAANLAVRMREALEPPATDRPPVG